MADGILQRLGDAIAGTDRQGAYLEGVQARQDLDYGEQRTQSAMALARRRRLEAERQARENEAVAEAERALNADPNSVPLGALTVGDLGSSYSGATQGRLRTQEYLNRETIGDPTAAEPERRASAQAVYPNDLASLGDAVDDPGPLELVRLDDGSVVYQPRSEAVGMPPGARPSASSGGELGLGGIEATDERAIYAQAGGLWGGTIDPTTGRFTSLDPVSAQRAQAVADLATRLYAGGGLTRTNAVSRAYRTLADREGWAENPLSEESLGDAATGGQQQPAAGAGASDLMDRIDVPGDRRMNPQTGQVIELGPDGAWYDVETGERVQ